jgi:predicted  nucleic acid-binding Zn-ribbon protein
MSASLSLYRLQQIDSQIDQITGRLEDIQKTLENDDQLKLAVSNAASSEDKLHKAQIMLHRAESETEAQRVKIQQSESSLYGGNVKNPKELQDLQNEVAALKRHLATLEDRQLEAMLANDEAETALKQAQSNLTNTRSKLATQNSSLNGEQDTLNKNLERLRSERQAVTGDLDKNLLLRYEELRQDRRGVAVANVSEDACSACGTTLTPSQQQAARAFTQITFCPTCGRFLYSG